MLTRILLRLLLWVGLATPLCALALGVGPIEVRSALNQNLEADIPLIVNNPAELVGLTVQIPRQQEFDRLGVERLEFLSQLRFAVQTAPGGPNQIKITSTQPIREPSFDLLMEVIWPRGRLLRTFPVHLDPELYANRRPPAPPAPTSVIAPPVAETPPPVAAAPATPSLPPAPAVSFEGASFYGPIRRGENLTRIARQVRPSEAISVPQMMSILIAGNPEAFSNGNPNTLRLGAVLKVPTAQALGISGAPTPAPTPDIAAVTPVEPASGLPPPVEPTPVEPTSVQPTPVEPIPAPPTSPAAETPATTAPPPTPVEPAPTPLAETPATLPPQPALPQPQEIVPQTLVPLPPPTETPPPAAQPPVAETPPPATQPPVAETPPPAAQPPVAETPPPATQPAVLPEETGMDWLSNPVVWIAIALIGLAIIAVLLLPLLRRPARARAASAEPESAPPEAAEPVAAKSETRTSMRREPRSRRPALDIAAAAAGESAEAQPLAMAEAPVKPAPKAATPPPKPIDELLKNIDFNLGEERPRATPEGQGPARRMPDAEPPTASVTRTTGLAAPPPAPAPTPKPAPPASPPPSVEPLSELPTGLQFDKLDFDLSELGLDSTRKPAELPPLELKPKPAAPAAQTGIKPAAPAQSDDWATLDFNLPDLTPPPAEPAAAQPPKPKPADLKFQFSDVAQEPGRSEEQARLDEELQNFGGELDLGKITLDSPGPGAGAGEAGVGYIETKLDLAAAYLDMGDQVGARGLLEDVLQEGNAAQKKQAEDLLKKLG